MAHLDEFRLATVGFLVLWWEFRALAKPNVKLDGSFQHDEDLTPRGWATHWGKNDRVEGGQDDVRLARSIN